MMNPSEMVRSLRSHWGYNRPDRTANEIADFIEALTRPLTLDECRDVLNANRYNFEREGRWTAEDHWVVDEAFDSLRTEQVRLTHFEARCLARGFMAEGGRS